MHEAQGQLSELVRAAEQGQEVILERAGVPVARILAYTKREERVLGMWKGRVVMSDDFDKELDESD